MFDRYSPHSPRRTTFRPEGADTLMPYQVGVMKFGRWRWYSWVGGYSGGWFAWSKEKALRKAIEFATRERNRRLNKETHTLWG